MSGRVCRAISATFIQPSIKCVKRTNNPVAVASLLHTLRVAGAGEQVKALASRAAEHVPLDSSRAAVDLLTALRKADAGEPFRRLIGRLPAEGQFQLFFEQIDGQGRYR
jgi:hypothetical protein